MTYAEAKALFRNCKIVDGEIIEIIFNINKNIRFYISEYLGNDIEQKIAFEGKKVVYLSFERDFSENWDYLLNYSTLVVGADKKLVLTDGVIADPESFESVKNAIETLLNELYYRGLDKTENFKININPDDLNCFYNKILKGKEIIERAK